MAKNPIRAIADRIVSPALEKLGERWSEGNLEVYQERRACEIVLRTLHRLEAFLPAPAAEAPLAIGGSPAGDPYTVPTAIAEIVLREVGYRAESLGSNLPGETFAAAIRQLRPALAWLSISYITGEDDFLSHYDRMRDAAAGSGSQIAVGGRALGAQLRMRMEFAFFGDSMSHLACYAKSLRTGAS